jgi:hypothetical protein
MKEEEEDVNVEDLEQTDIPATNPSEEENNQNE